MATQVLTIHGKPSYASFWPSIAAASAQLSQRRFARSGRVPSGNPAVSGLPSPGFVGRRGSDQPSTQKGTQKGGV